MAKMVKVASFWVAKDKATGEIKLDRNGNKYFSGRINPSMDLSWLTSDTRLTVYQNDKTGPDANPKWPDLNIMMYPPEESQQTVIPQSDSNEDVPF